MWVVSKKRLREFWTDHQESEGPPKAWHKVAEQSSWANFAEVRDTCANSVDRVGRCIVFNIGGNKYRLVATIEFDWGKVFVKEVLTHKEYDRGHWKRYC